MGKEMGDALGLELISGTAGGDTTLNFGREAVKPCSEGDVDFDRVFQVEPVSALEALRV